MSAHIQHEQNKINLVVSGENPHLPVGTGRPGEDEAAGQELRDESRTEARRSSEQSGLPGRLSIPAHHFPTSSASFGTREPGLELADNFFIFIYFLPRFLAEA